MDEPEKKQDVNTSAETKETSEAKPETFTKEQLAEAKQQGKSDGLADVGRLKKENEKLVATSQKLNTRIDRFYKDQDEAELEANKGNPEQLNAIRERQGKRAAESNLDSVTQELDEANQKLKLQDAAMVESTKERKAREVATRLGVDEKRLAKLVRFTDGSDEVIEDIAKELPKKGEAKALVVDSSKTTGPSQMPDSSGAKMTAGWDKLHPQG